MLKDVFGGSSDIETEEVETTQLSFLPTDSQLMDEEFQKQLLKDVFGGSSDSEAGELCSSSPTCQSVNGECANPSNRWQRIEAINGLSLCRDFLSPLQQSSLLDSIQAEGWFTEASQNQGICAHVDLMRFDDGIAIVSLESPFVMHFSPVEKDGEDVPPAMKIPVYLNPGSLAIMWGDVRYRWKHEINRNPGFQGWNGQEIEQKRRTSVTLRKLRVSD